MTAVLVFNLKKSFLAFFIEPKRLKAIMMRFILPDLATRGLIGSLGINLELKSHVA